MAMAATLGCASHLLIEGTGHDEELFSSTDEMRRRVVAFVAGE